MKKLIFSFGSYLLSNLLVLLINTIINLLIPKFLNVNEFGLYRKILVFFSYSGILSFGIGEYMYCYFSDNRFNYGIKEFKHNYILVTIVLIVILIFGIIAGVIYDNLVSLFIFLAVLFNSYSVIEIFYNTQRKFNKINIMRIIRTITYFVLILLNITLFNINAYNILLSLSLSYFVIVIIETKKLKVIESILDFKFSLNEEKKKLNLVFLS